MELISINEKDGIKTVSARELWQGLESKRQFGNWIQDRLDGFIEDKDFIINKYVKVQIEGNREVNRPVIEYHLTLDTAKHICMLERNEKGRQIRQYFIDVENRSRQVLSGPALMAAALIEAQKTLDNQAMQIEQLKPKADFYDAVTGSSDTIEIGEAAKVLAIKGLGRNNLFELLRQKGVLMQNNQPYQKYIDCGYFRTIESSFTKPDGTTHINIKTVVYQKGLDFIRKVVS